MSYKKFSLEEIEMLIERCGGAKAVEGILSGNLVVSTSQVEKKWYEKDGIIYFSVDSNDIDGAGWIKHLADKKISIGEEAKRVLSSEYSKPRKDVRYQVALIPGKKFSDEERTNQAIHKEAENLKFSKIKTETACLIRDRFTDSEVNKMGLKQVVTVSDEHLFLFGGSIDEQSFFKLDDHYKSPKYVWPHNVAFAFAVSEEEIS